MKTIVALIDFSDVTERVLKQAEKSALQSGSRVILMHVVPKEPVVVDVGIASPTILEPPSAETIKVDYQKLMDCRALLAMNGVDVVVEQIIDGGVEQILKESLRWNAELIILGSHHHSPLYNLFVGSFTQDITMRAHCPLLLVPVDSEEL